MNMVGYQHLRLKDVVFVAPKRKNYNKTPELIIAPRQPNRYKHYHMFQVLVHKNNVV